MSFVPGTHFYRQKTKYTKPAAKPIRTTSCPFCSTLFVNTDFQNCFVPNWNVHPDQVDAFSTCLVNDDMEQTDKPCAFLIADTEEPTCV
jgi:hypothetical protein